MAQEEAGKRNDKGAELERELDHFQDRLYASTPQVMVTPAFVGLNILIFIAMIFSGVSFWNPSVRDLIHWGANFGPKTLDGEWWRLLSNFFIHIGLAHLLFNMYVFWTVGLLVERMLGNLGFMVVYLLAGFGGSFASLIWNPVAVSAGASGSIFGIFGALLGLLVRGQLALPSRVRRAISRDAVVFLGYNLVAGATQPSIDMAAHLGGLACGFLCGLALAHPLSPEGVQLGNRRGVWLLIGGLLIFSLAYLGFPRDAVRFEREMGRFVVLDIKADLLFRQSLALAGQGKLLEKQVIDLIEKRILPDWKTSRQGLGSLKHLPPRLRNRIQAILTYADLKQESWVLFAEGIKKNNQSLIQKANAKRLEAERIKGRQQNFQGIGR
jgi:rhomboid protease GluP